MRGDGLSFPVSLGLGGESWQDFHADMKAAELGARGSEITREDVEGRHVWRGGDVV
jgi:hypothetical protein